jgi:hypothetical protein
MKSSPSPRCMVKNTAFVVSVVEFGAIRSDATANFQKHFGCAEHAQGGCYEINPQRMPVIGMKC